MQIGNVQDLNRVDLSCFGEELFESGITKKAHATLTGLSEGGSLAYQALSTSGRFFDEVFPQAESLFDVACNALFIFGEFLQDVKKFSEKLAKFRVVSILSAPFRVYDLAMSIKSVVEGMFEKAYVKVSDSILDVIDHATEITRFVSLFVTNAALSTAAGFFSAINIVIHGKQLFHSIRFHRALGEEIDEYDFKKRLDLDESIREQVNTALQKGGEQVMKAIRKRSIQQITSHALQVTAAVITIVASAIFLVCPPLAPIAFGLWGLASLISLADFIADKVVAHQVKKSVMKNFA